MSMIAARGELQFAGLRNITGVDDRALRHAAARGELTRIRRGVYVQTVVWRALTRDERSRLLVAAVLERARGESVACHESAAALWGIPLVGPPATLVHVVTSSALGTRTEHGFRKHAADVPEQHLATVDGLSTTTLERTVVDLAAALPFPEAVVAADWALGRGIDRATLELTLDEAAPTRHRARADAVLRFADARAGSPGESLSRAFMRLLRLPAPDLQVPFSDRRGFIGFVDFYWSDHQLIGEFDGRVKYTDERMLAGRTASDVVVGEKHREDRLRARGPRVARWTWLDLATPAALGQVLAEAGIHPRR